jgi:hypothetical protein
VAIRAAIPAAIRAAPVAIRVDRWAAAGLAAASLLALIPPRVPRRGVSAGVLRTRIPGTQDIGRSRAMFEHKPF